ncbi:MAG: 6,7-dimethyl-8-ribityllumazine synthase [Desulfurococcales archaeon]|nr:6,7-dimethyl-8-ribityllumazine synthase [Desulfurococcales archaeon]
MERIAIVVSEFNFDVTRIMLEKALSHAKFLGAEVTVVAKSPGTFDSPYLVREVIEKDYVDGVVVLGAVIKGETDHDEVVAHQAARKILDIGVEKGKPVSLGVIGPGVSRPQALERAEEYAARAVEAVVKAVRRIRSLRKAEFKGETLVIE